MTTKMKRLISVASALVIAAVLIVGISWGTVAASADRTYQGPIVSLVLENYPSDQMAFSVGKDVPYRDTLLGAINKVLEDLGEEKIAELVKHHTDLSVGRTSTLSFDVPTPASSGNTIYFYTSHAMPPVSYLGANNTTAGFNYDIARFAAVELGMRLEVRFSVFGGIIQAVTQSSSEWRLVGDGVYITPAREEVLAFSNVYWRPKLEVISRESNSWNTLAQLDGKRIAGLSSGIGAIYIQNKLDDGTLSSKTRLLEYTTIQTAFKDFLAGRSDCVVYPCLGIEMLLASR